MGSGIRKYRKRAKYIDKSKYIDASKTKTEEKEEKKKPIDEFLKELGLKG